MHELPRAAIFATWGTAALAGRCGVEDAAEAVAAGLDATHLVAGLPGTDDVVALPAALGRLADRGATGLRLVLPRPGDPSGLPGPPRFTEAAVSVGSAVVAVGAPVGLLAEGRGAWRAYAVEPDQRTRPSIREAMLELTRTIGDVAADLGGLDVAHWDPAAAEVLAARTPSVRLPPGWPGPAALLLTSAMRMSAVAEVALRGEGAALSVPEIFARRAALGRLADAARWGIEVACSQSVEVESIARG